MHKKSTFFWELYKKCLQTKIFYAKMIAFNKYLPKWRNGRRTGLKIPRGQLHEGSTPSFGTNEKTALTAQFCQQVSKHFALTLVFSFHDQTKIALRWRFCRDSIAKWGAAGYDKDSLYVFLLSVCLLLIPKNDEHFWGAPKVLAILS